MKLTKLQLSIIFSKAKAFYLAESPGDLDNQEFLVQCYLKAAIQELNLDLKLKFPDDRKYDSIED